MFEQKNNGRIIKMREGMDNKLETILKVIRTNKSASTVTDSISERVETQNIQPSASKINKSIGVCASNVKNWDSENEDYFLRVSEMKDLRHASKPLNRIERDSLKIFHFLDKEISNSFFMEVAQYWKNPLASFNLSNNLKA